MVTMAETTSVLIVCTMSVLSQKGCERSIDHEPTAAGDVLIRTVKCCGVKVSASKLSDETAGDASHCRQGFTPSCLFYDNPPKVVKGSFTHGYLSFRLIGK